MAVTTTYQKLQLAHENYTSGFYKKTALNYMVVPFQTRKYCVEYICEVECEDSGYDWGQEFIVSNCKCEACDRFKKRGTQTITVELNMKMDVVDPDPTEIKDIIRGILDDSDKACQKCWHHPKTGMINIMFLERVE